MDTLKTQTKPLPLKNLEAAVSLIKESMRFIMLKQGDLAKGGRELNVEQYFAQ